MSQLARITRHELRALWRSGQARALLVTAGALLVVALLVGAGTARAQYQEREAAAQLARQQWEGQTDKNPHSAAHYGTHLFVPRTGLALADPGLSAYLGASLYVEAHRQNAATHALAQDSGALDRFGELSGASLLQLLGPLLVLFLGAGSVTREREAGTWKASQALGASPVSLLIGKGLALGMAVAMVLLPGWCLAVLLSPGALTDEWARWLLGAALYGAYLAIFVGLSLLTSIVSRTTRGALALGLGLWLGVVLLAPRLAVGVAVDLAPLPTEDSLRDDITRDLKDGIDGHDSADQRTKALQEATLAQYGVSRVEDLPINFDAVAMQAGEEYSTQVFARHFQRFWDGMAQQESLARSGAWLSPTLAARELSAALAWTSTDEHRRFTEAAEEYRIRFVRTLNEHMRDHSKTGDWETTAGAELWRAVPSFTYQAAPLAASLAGRWGAVASLLAWALFAWVGALLLVRRGEEP